MHALLHALSRDSSEESSSEESSSDESDDMEECLRRLRQGGHKRESAIKEALQHVTELYAEDAGAGRAFFQWIVKSIMSLESHHDWAEGLGWLRSRIHRPH